MRSYPRPPPHSSAPLSPSSSDPLLPPSLPSPLPLFPRPSPRLAVGPDAAGIAFDDAIWVYWSSNLTYFPPENRAVVLNRTNVITPSFQVGRIGLPTLVEVLGRPQLAMIYDGGGYRDDVSYNENCSVALAWIDRPLVPPPSSSSSSSSATKGA